MTKITSNQSKRHYTIYLNGSVYRTSKLSKLEFEELDYNTEKDWINYVRTNELIILK